jgi:protein-tyrosine-phosphatase
MCYNCGCGIPDDDMGVGSAGVDPNGKSITNKTFEEAAKSQGMSVEDAKKFTLEQLEKELGQKAG